jgi:hypothetical protein
MIWWYRNVFIDRNMPLTGSARDDSMRVSQKSENNLRCSVGNLLKAMKQKLQASLRAHYDWKVYKNLSDHQLKDIGLTRDGLTLLLHNQIPVIPQSRVKTVNKQQTVNHQSRLMNERDLEKAVELPKDVVCSNDCVEKVA